MSGCRHSEGKSCSGKIVKLYRSIFSSVQLKSTFLHVPTSVWNLWSCRSHQLLFSVTNKQISEPLAACVPDPVTRMCGDLSFFHWHVQPVFSQKTIVLLFPRRSGNSWETNRPSGGALTRRPPAELLKEPNPKTTRSRELSESAPF